MKTILIICHAKKFFKHSCNIILFVNVKSTCDYFKLLFSKRFFKIKEIPSSLAHKNP